MVITARILSRIASRAMRETCPAAHAGMTRWTAGMLRPARIAQWSPCAFGNWDIVTVWASGRRSHVPTRRSGLPPQSIISAPATAEAHGLPWDLWVVNTDGSGLRRLTQIYEDLPMAAFSPDGAQIAVMAAGGFYLMDSDGGNVRPSVYDEIAGRSR